MDNLRTWWSSEGSLRGLPGVNSHNDTTWVSLQVRQWVPAAKPTLTDGDGAATDRLEGRRAAALRVAITTLALTSNKRYQRYVTVIKAAGAAVNLINAPFFARWIMHHSSALVQDETGLLPSRLGEQQDWATIAFGNYSKQRLVAHKDLKIDLGGHFAKDHAREMNHVRYSE